MRESANAQSQPRMHIYISFVWQAIGAFMNVSRRQYTAYVINFRYFYEILRGISMPLRPDLLIHTISSLTLLNDKTFVMQFNGLSVRVHCLVAECRNQVILCDTATICPKIWNAESAEQTDNRCITLDCSGIPSKIL